MTTTGPLESLSVEIDREPHWAWVTAVVGGRRYERLLSYGRLAAGEWERNNGDADLLDRLVADLGIPGLAPDECGDYGDDGNRVVATIRQQIQSAAEAALNAGLSQ